MQFRPRSALPRPPPPPECCWSRWAWGGGGSRSPSCCSARGTARDRHGPSHSGANSAAGFREEPGDWRYHRAQPCRPAPCSGHLNKGDTVASADERPLPNPRAHGRDRWERAQQTGPLPGPPLLGGSYANSHRCLGNGGHGWERPTAGCYQPASPAPEHLSPALPSPALDHCPGSQA